VALYDCCVRAASSDRFDRFTVTLKGRHPERRVALLLARTQAKDLARAAEGLASSFQQWPRHQRQKPSRNLTSFLKESSQI
jgi:hypothetical protein